MATSAPQNGHILGPRDTRDPKQGSLGPHSACDQIWSAGDSPRADPKTRKIHFLAFWARGVAKFLPGPQKPVNREFLKKTWVEPPNVVKVRKLRNVNAVPMSQKKVQKIPGGAELQLKRVYLG